MFGINKEEKKLKKELKLEKTLTRACLKNILSCSF